MKTSAFRAAFYLYHSLYLVINLTFPSDICSWKISTRTLFWRVWLVNMLKHNAQCSKSVSDSFWIIVLVAHHEPPLNWNKTECIRMSTHISAYTRLNVFFFGYLGSLNWIPNIIEVECIAHILEDRPIKQFFFLYTDDIWCIYRRLYIRIPNFCVPSSFMSICQAYEASVSFEFIWINEC